jgi:hypothetical protein
MIGKIRGHRIYQQPTETAVRESAGSGFGPRLVCFGGPGAIAVLTTIVHSPQPEILSFVRTGIAHRGDLATALTASGGRGEARI